MCKSLHLPSSILSFYKCVQINIFTFCTCLKYFKYNIEKQSWFSTFDYVQ